MQQFKEYLEDEGFPTNEDRIEFILPVVKNLDGKKLTSIRLKEAWISSGTAPSRCSTSQPELLLKQPGRSQLVSKNSIEAEQRRASHRRHRRDGRCVFKDKHLAFMDIDAICFRVAAVQERASMVQLEPAP